MRSSSGSRDGRHPDKRRQMERPEEYGQVRSGVSKRDFPPHPGTKERVAGTRHTGRVKGGEQAKPGQMPGDEDKSAKED
ncbi:MAG TPA: hypothetical protein VMU22_12815 [Rhizomicrobium sp.]|nr:hypothetical protein [Rhizomicrobium sp.]